ncbi:MAG: preprotein translocase subunit SecG [Planctomycetota bacterium]
MLAFLDTFLATLFIIICVLLIFVVLLQKGRGGGLSAAFSGMGSSAFGTRVGDVLTWVTIVMTALFLVLATAVTLRFKPASAAADAPTFIPAQMPIREKTAVSIFGSKGAKFWYTLNQSEPKKGEKGSTEYKAAVAVEPGQTLKARAYVEGLDASEVTTAEYRIDSSKPDEGIPPASAPAPVTTAPSPVSASLPAAGLVPATPPTEALVPATAPAK